METKEIDFYDTNDSDDEGISSATAKIAPLIILKYLSGVKSFISQSYPA